MEVAEFIHLENLKLYKKQLSETTSEAQRKRLLTLLNEEQQKDQDHRSPPKPKNLSGACA